ncbi:MAG: 1,4-alpha-glucan-branching protein [Pedobacter sp.]|nr:MAG: 1,4-alpha-glucan-branching protein [Pedobacter sp.]
MRKIYILLCLFTLVFSACRKSNPGTGDDTTPVVPVNQTGLVTASTSFPGADNTFVLTFDATKGNKALQSYTGDIYIYTAVITDKSTGPSDWKYIKSSSFNTADAAAKMTAGTNHTYQISISPRSFYGVPPTEKILKMVMLFRTADGTMVGRNADNSDIYLPIYETGSLNVAFNAPELLPTYVPSPAVSIKTIGETLLVSAVASKTANLTLTLNGVSFATANNTTSIQGTAKFTASGPQEIKVTATDGSVTAQSTFTFLLNGTVQTLELPAAAKQGVVFLNGGKSAILTLYAPGKQNVYVIGDFNNWQPVAAQFMNKTPDGNFWWIQIDNLDPAQEYAYQYFVDNTLKIADPYTEKVLDSDNDGSIPSATYPNLRGYPTGKTSGIVSVMQGNAPTYNFQISGFNRPDKNNLVVYELHLRDFLKNGNYKTLTDTLGYLSRLGVNAIELMPITEFEGNSSWGYNPTFYFAPDKAYGTKVALQGFIDECHRRGIAVIMDMVLNHSFGQSPMVQLYFDAATGKPASNSPWFNADPTHPFNVGFDFNHESAATKTFTKNVLKFWMQQYRVDGFRFDLSKGFTQKNSGTSDAAVTAWSAYDAGRVAIWKDYNAYMKSIDPNFYVILEHFAADDEEKELAADGMLLWNNVNGSFNEATMGYNTNSDFSRAFFGLHGFTKPDNLVTYIESHDEERTMTKNLAYGNASGTYNVKDLATALKREELAAAFLFSVPGPKMIWQFEELGYEIGINVNGRLGEKPIHWEYTTQAARKTLYNAYAHFISLKKNNTVFSTTNLSFSVGGNVKSMRLTDANNVVMIVGNFDVVNQTANVDFGSSGVWFDNSGGDQITLSGTAYSKTLTPGEYHIYSKKLLKD